MPNSQNIRVYGGANNHILTAAQGAVAPTSGDPATIPSLLSNGWYDIGWLTDDTGLTENSTVDSTEIYGWQGSPLVRTLKQHAKHTFSFEAMEENTTVLSLARPASTPTVTGATQEVQTITLTGATGGTWADQLAGYGGVSGLAYNITTSALATALSSAFGITVTVTGTAGSSYQVTFPTSVGNVPQMTVQSSLTGTSPTIAVATTTPGVNGISTWHVKPYVGLNLRQFAIFLNDGTIQTCKYIQNGEAVLSGSPAYKAGAQTVFAFDVNVYVDINGDFYQEFTNNPAVGQTFV